MRETNGVLQNVKTAMRVIILYKRLVTVSDLIVKNIENKVEISSDLLGEYRVRKHELDSTLNEIDKKQR